MDTKELKEVLALHKVWFDSDGAKGKKAYLSGAGLTEVDLTGADLWRADLSGADLREACLYGADLWGADLRGADLRGADLRGSSLYGADLREADLSGAYLSGAGLTEADLTGAKVALELREVRILWESRVSKEHLPWIVLNPRHSKWFETLKVSA